ncbi:hypothetical protein GCM10027203_49350 [Nonomuraea fastidiosa]|jgi:hypothetical protein
MFLSKMRTARQAPVPAPQPDRSRAGVEDAWRALSLVVDLVKHAENKAGFTLAASGVIGGLVYTLIRTTVRPSALFSIAVAICALLVIGAACCAGLSLLPRRVNVKTAGLLYYHQIAKRYRDRPDAYAGDLGGLIRDPDALTTAVAEQVWANAQVASRKYRWSSLGIIAMLAALAALTITAVIAVVQGT